MKKSVLISIVLVFVFFSKCNNRIDNNPIRIHPQNFLFFADNSGKAIVLTGSHTWMRKRAENRQWISDDWNLQKFRKYLDFLEYWNHNYIRLWMWEQEGTVNIWVKEPNGKYDLSKLNHAYFDLVKSFVAEAESRGFFVGVMLFQGWSGCCEASIPDWPSHPMNINNNINGVDGDPDGLSYGKLVHSLEIPEIVRFQEMYLMKMINELNDFNNVIWEIGNETIRSSIPWKTHMVQFIREYENKKPKQHLILDGTGNGVGNQSVWITEPDIFSPCVITQWANLNDPYIDNPPVPADSLGKPIILDNDHLGNHFLRFSPINQRNWTWKAFIRGNHPIHMDCYDIFWDGEDATPDHPIMGVATNPHYDPQRKSLGDVQLFAAKVDLAKMKPVTDPDVCSTTFCLMDAGKKYLAYQPQVDGDITIHLASGNYEVETFDSVDSSSETSTIQWNGGNKTFVKPAHISEDWVILISVKS